MTAREQLARSVLAIRTFRKVSTYDGIIVPVRESPHFAGGIKCENAGTRKSGQSNVELNILVGEVKAY